MDENDIRQAFGLEDTSAEDDAGENDQEVAAPEEQAEEPETEENPDASETDGSSVQSPEERSRQAYGRRQRELKAAEDAARADERGKVDRLLKSLGIKNPKSGEAVDTLDALESYERELVTHRIESGKPRQDDIERVVNEVIDRRNNPPAPKIDPAEAQRIVDQQITQIRQIDPTVKGLDDILMSDVGPAFRECVRNGMSFYDAYSKVAQGRISAANRAAAEQAARNRTASKDHLSGTISRGKGSKAVPRAELDIFRALMPDTPDSEFEKYYNR